MNSPALQYRSLFIEKGSQFTSNKFRLAGSDELKDLAKDLLKELRILTLMSREARLREANNIEAILGSDPAAIAQVQHMQQVWFDQKLSIYQGAEDLIQAKNPDDLKKARDSFAAKLDVFREQTMKINTVFTKKVLERLGEIIAADGG